MLIKSVSHLHQQNQLPATYFVLNRNNCSKFAKLLPQNLISGEDSARSVKLFDKYLLRYRDRYEKTEQYNEIKKLLAKGIAILSGRNFVTPDDLLTVSYHCLMHRMIFYKEPSILDLEKLLRKMDI